MIYHGDLFDVLPTLEAESIDACVTDPPYGIGFMGKEWDSFKPGEEAKRIVPNRLIESDNPNLRGRTRGPASSPSAVVYDESVIGHEAFMRWTTRWASEVFRVLKPGAHLLVCGAPRSYHWMACGLEYAGFQIRDSFLYWGFGQGFPKSLNVSNDPRFCQCQKERREHGSSPVSDLRNCVDANEPLSGSTQQVMLTSVRECVSEQAEEKTSRAALECGVCDVQEAISLTAESPDPGKGADVLSPVQRKNTGTGTASLRREYEGKEASRSEVWPEQSSMEGRRDVLPEAWELQADQVRAMSSQVLEHGTEGRLRDGASATNGDVDRLAASAVGSGASRRSRSTEQQPDESRALAGQPEPQTTRRWPLCDRCGKSVVPSGLGTALKPSYEPIVVARKPLRGTVARNVLEHGTGALNIDACRIPSGADHAKKCRSVVGLASKRNGNCYSEWSGERSDSFNDLGRWPANVLLDEQSAAQLDAMTGELQSGNLSASVQRGSFGTHGIYGKSNGGVDGRDYKADSGGASRFFLTVGPDCCLCEGVCRTTSASSAGRSLETIRATIAAIALSSVDTTLVEQLALAAPCAGSLCERCVTFIALTFVERLAPPSVASTAFLASIGASKRSILIQHLAFSAALPASTDITQITANLSLLCGSVCYAIGASTSKANGVVLGNTAPDQTRFRYSPKPSREERDYGCEHLRARSGGEATDRRDGTAGLNNPRAGAGRTGGARNVHPTVKPVELMRWLVRLVTPPDGIVLDPFTGSGTTGMACRYEHRKFIGIEREAEYVQIAEARIAAVAPLFGRESDTYGAGSSDNA